MNLRGQLVRFGWKLSDIWHAYGVWPVRELIGQITHKQSRLLVWRKQLWAVDLVYKAFKVPHGTCKYACRRCTMELHWPIQARYYDVLDMFACLRCNQWLEPPGVYGVPENAPRAYLS